MQASAPSDLRPPVPPVKRRAFLVRTALAAAVPLAVGLLGRHRWLADLSPAAAALGPAPLPGLDAFAAVAGSGFTVIGEAGQPSFLLTLSKAEALRNHRAGGAESFSLRFTPPAGRVLESRTYALAHPVLGRMDLFLCPVGSAARFHEDQKAEAIIDFHRHAA
jgi:hypothetical protein